MRVLLLAEAPSDARRAKTLIDKALVESVQWLAEHPEEALAELLDGLRSWCRIDSSHDFLDIHQIRKLAEHHNIPPRYGHFDGARPSPDFALAVRALRLARILDPRPEAIVWIRDIDDRPAREDGWRQACSDAGAGFSALVGAFPNQCMEAWLLAAWQPDTEARRHAQHAERQRLGFDPVAHPERLDHADNVPKSAKAVMRTLGASDADIEARTIEELRQLGGACGLRAFLDEVLQTLVGLLSR